MAANSPPIATEPAPAPSPRPQPPKIEPYPDIFFVEGKALGASGGQHSR